PEDRDYLLLFHTVNKNFLIEFDSSVICEIKDLEERGPGQKFRFRSSCSKASSFRLPVC
ncbi:mCG141883, partial [Mus musculus]